MQAPDASSTIARFSASLHLRRASATTSYRREGLSPDIPTEQLPPRPTAPTRAIFKRHRKAAFAGGLQEAFGWAKTIAGMAKVKVRGLARVRHCFTLAMVAYNLIRMPRLLAEAA